MKTFFKGFARLLTFNFCDVIFIMKIAHLKLKQIEVLQ